MPMTPEKKYVTSSDSPDFIPYREAFCLTGNRGNNAFVQAEVTIPSLRIGTLEEVRIGTDIVFREKENGSTKDCTGLEHFVELIAPSSPRITIFDNHNHALYFWTEAMHDGLIEPGCELIHIDEHSDLWENQYSLDREKALTDKKYAWEFTNYRCNVGNYIQPALRSGLIRSMHRIENNYQVDAMLNYTPSRNTILNIDLDFFAPEMSFIDNTKKIQLIRNLLPQVQCVTIATSPYFMEP